MGFDPPFAYLTLLEFELRINELSHHGWILPLKILTKQCRLKVEAFESVLFGGNKRQHIKDN